LKAVPGRDGLRTDDLEHLVQQRADLDRLEPGLDLTAIELRQVEEVADHFQQLFSGVFDVENPGFLARRRWLIGNGCE
jgi:hypothetical protein